MVLIGWLLNTPPGLEGKADAVGYALCHQIPARSFQINGQPISLCARCTGMYVGLMIGLIYQTVLGRRRSSWPRNAFLAVLAVFFLAFAVDGSQLSPDIVHRQRAAVLAQQHPPSVDRNRHGPGDGGHGAANLSPDRLGAVRPASGTSLPGGSSWGSWRPDLAAPALILTENPFILQAFTYLGVLGIVIILTLLYSMILMVDLRPGKQHRPPDRTDRLAAGRAAGGAGPYRRGEMSSAFS